MSKLYIPPPEFSFRLLTVSYQDVMVSKGSELGMFHRGDVYPDQWWQLIPGTGKLEGYYSFKSKFTGLCLFSKSGQVGTADGDGKYDDNWFTLEAGTGKHTDTFRLPVYIDSSLVLACNPLLGNFRGPVYVHQFFTFLFEDTIFDRIDYHLDRAAKPQTMPHSLGSRTEKNGSSLVQTAHIQWGEKATKTHSFDYALGFKMTASVSAKVGIPEVAEGEVKVEVSNSHDLKWGTIESEEQTFTATFDIQTPPHTAVTSSWSVNRSNLEVPFTIVSKSVSTGFEVWTEGVFHGVSFWNLSRQITETPLTY